MPLGLFQDSYEKKHLEIKMLCGLMLPKFIKNCLGSGLSFVVVLIENLSAIGFH